MAVVVSFSRRVCPQIRFSKCILGNRSFIRRRRDRFMGRRNARFCSRFCRCRLRNAKLGLSKRKFGIGRRDIGRSAPCRAFDR
jgi:hypothetical protein